MVLRRDSLNEILYVDKTEVPKQRFWYDFTGGELNTNVWTKRIRSGSGSVNMIDEVDEGIEVRTGVSTNNSTALDNNGIHQYDRLASTWLWTARISHITSINNLSGGTTCTCYGFNFMGMGASLTLSTNFYMRTSNTSTFSHTATSIPSDTNWHLFKVICKSGVYTGFMGGILEITKTNDLPTLNFFPYQFTGTLTNAARYTRMRHFEAFNT